MLSLRPKYLKRYASLARLLYKYGRSDLLKATGLESTLRGDEPPPPSSGQPSPDDFADDLESLGPAYIKLGQILSTRADMLSRPYLDALSRLQDQVTPVPIDQVREILREELGLHGQVFTEFDARPLATASLGQVHRATLCDGRRVAVKVQRPGIRAQLIDDIDAMYALAELLDQYSAIGRRYQFTQLVETLRRAIQEELNYLSEAENARTLRSNLKDDQVIYVPRPIAEYTTARVLTMEYFEGSKITELAEVELATHNGPDLAARLFDAYLRQVLVDGVFHADPHPGNVMLSKDGRVALLDFGMVVRVPPELQRHFSKLLLTVSEGRGEDAADAAIAAGVEAREFDKAGFRRRIAQLVATHHGVPVERLQAGPIVLAIHAVAGETGLKLPQEFTMLGKTLMNLDRVLGVLDPRFDVNAAMRERSGAILREQSMRRFSLGQVYESIMDLTELTASLPKRINQITHTLAENELRVRVDAIDERRFIAGMQKIANRITLGVILAGLIIGASWMMRLETSWTILGYPAIAMIFFLFAASAGVYLVVRSLLKDENE